jgi:hypothetical protein
MLSRNRFMLFAVCLSAQTTLGESAQGTVLWMDQAQRLQEVSATLLDTMPVAVPVPQRSRLGVRADISFLPTPNPRVGAKLESLPSAPVQSIPSVYASTGLALGSSESISGEVWVGFLPRGVEKLMGIKASLQQIQWGVRSELSSVRAGAARWLVGGGLAQTRSSISGSISSLNGTDSFSATSMLSFMHVSVQHVRSGLWGAVTLGQKDTKSRLTIEEDKTDLEIRDTLQSAKQPRWTQVSLGLNISESLSIAISELMVPDRIDMPRLSFAWTVLESSGTARQ